MSMATVEYERCLRDLLSREPEKVREANRKLYSAVVIDGLASEAPDRYNGDSGHADREADLALARAAA